MNCREIQGQLHAAPFERDADVLTHFTRCSECRCVAAELLRFERDLVCAALALRVPERLSDRVLLQAREFSRKVML